ncbi:MAG: starch-binding protein, partial [Ruminococcus sp.]|nr:starch-binding protein [Ruminococcus sp.]
MKTFKKSVALFLSVLMLLSMLTVAASVTAFAADQATVTIKANPGVFNTVQKTVNVGDEIVVTLNLKSDNLFVSGQFDFDYDKSVFKVTNQEDILYDVVIPDPDIYDYDGSALFTNGSKGIKMTEKTPVYSTTFKVLKATGNLTLTLNTRILIGTKGKASNSADELVYIADGEWSIKEGYEESIDVEVVPGSGQDDPVKPDPTDTTIYFIASGDAANWGEYHAHMWNEAGATTEWPGVAMTKTSQKTSAGYAIYSVTFTDDYDTVIFVKNKDDESGKAQATIQAGKYYDYASRKWLDKPDDTPQTDVLGTGLFVRGDFNAWNPVDSYEFKKTSASSNTARLSINVTTVKDYAFKVADASWGSSNYGGTATFTRTSNKATLENGNQSNLTLSADKAGTYVFEFNMSTAELTVTFPDGSVTPKPTEAESKPSTGGTITFKFTNNQGWDKIYVHSWGADGDLTTWPGNQMTESETNGYGETVYTITIPANAKGCVINNGDGAQTVDIENFNVEGYYTDGTKDDKEHFYVFPWGGSGEGDETTPSGSSKDFYLFGMINGVANVGEGEDNWQNLTDYKFTYVGNNTY